MRRPRRLEELQLPWTRQGGSRLLLPLEQGFADGAEKRRGGAVAEFTAPVAAAGMGDRDALAMETLLAFRRAGCSGVLTYFAPLAARLLAG